MSYRESSYLIVIDSPTKGRYAFRAPTGLRKLIEAAYAESWGDVEFQLSLIDHANRGVGYDSLRGAEVYVPEPGSRLVSMAKVGEANWGAPPVIDLEAPDRFVEDFGGGVYQVQPKRPG